jgi:hypothetical protein
VVGAGAGQIAQVGGHGAEVAVPSGHVRVVGTVAVVDVRPPSWLWHSEGPGP